ncbi:MAG: 2Fe-2S iron-sulfur cluster binding domain-containing protein [Bacilli bacterium]|nr:2Fe-2S iron-sulfur cluster binding domain-containing protein [Bacilli bacterium]
MKPGEYLLDTLRSHNIKSVKKGCDGSACGVCTVLLDDKPVLSCSVLTAKVESHNVITVEAIQEEAAELSEYYAKEGSDQCGFCNAAHALMVHALKKENPNPTDEEIRNYMVGNLCRCTGYQGQQRAIKAYLGGKK